MSRLLLLARGDHRAFRHIDGRSILSDLPFDVHVFADRACAGQFPVGDDRVTLEIVRWSDAAAISARAAALHDETPFTGVATFDENLMLLAGRLRETLGVAGMDEALTERFRDKRLMKDLLGKAGMRVPHYAPCGDRDAVAAILARYGHIVVKPFDGLGSRGVCFIETAQEMDAWYDGCDSVSGYQAEEYIEGTLYHVNALVLDGRPVLTASAPYLPGMANIDFVSGAPFVSVTLEPSKLRDRLEAFSDAAIAVLGLRNGVTHLECFVTPQDDLVFCEIAARPGGGGIVLMIELQHDVHFGRALAMIEAGYGPSVQFQPHAACDGVAGLVGFRWPTSGFVRQVPSPDRFNESWIHHFSAEVAPGDFVPACAHCTDYVGLMILMSKDSAQFDVRRRQVHDRFYQDFAVEAA